MFWLGEREDQVQNMNILSIQNAKNSEIQINENNLVVIKYA
jgi:hypothetical protein